MSRRLLILLAVLALAVAALSPVAAGAEEAPGVSELSVPDRVLDDIKNSKVQTYIVQMLDMPVVAYDGEVKGYPATKPSAGKKIDPNSGKVEKYAGYLRNSHDAALNRSGGNKVVDYVYSYNGFSAELSGVQASSLLSDPTVLAVTPDKILQLDTSTTPDFLGLTGEDGAWDKLGGADNAGEGVIVGIIDSGIWPENPSFDDRTGTSPNGKEGKLDYRQVPGWHGKCTPGEEFPASDCNQKLIGAQWFSAGFGGDAQVKIDYPYEYASARDADGHGSHTASTAAGNAGVQATIDGIDFGTISGMAPRARIAMYKVCWGNHGEGGCSGVDLVSAIDQAVADGVDVINYSISGSLSDFLDPVEVSFLFAADAGIFVSASAGNDGPGASTVAHNSPWLMTVAAGTHDRLVAGTADTGDGGHYEGAMLSDDSVTGDLIYAGDVGDSECHADTLDDAAVAGKIVVCDRGDIARVDKSAEVLRAGGIGMIHANVSPSSINADLHAVPTLHVDHVDGASIRAYAQLPSATVTIEGGDTVVAEAPEVAGFSSRGPALASSDLLKPDIMAPGVDVLAAVSPIGYDGHDYDLLSGTSMSSPHIAGLAALLTQAHPDWSPTMAKSALMTTASQTTNMGNPIAGTPFGYGAGQVDPTAALDPGLVYDAGWNEWLAFLCGSTGGVSQGTCDILAGRGYSFDASDLNYPSITVGELPGSQTVTRTVTNVGNSTATYTATSTGLIGVDVVVSPDHFTLAPGETADYDVTFTVGSAAIGDYVFGSLTWTDGTHSARSPLTVRPVLIGVSNSESYTGTSGSDSIPVDFGYTGSYTVDVEGLVPADTQVGSVNDDPTNDYNTALDTCDWSLFPASVSDCTGITWHTVSVPPGSTLARISLFDEYTSGNDDLDLYVYTGSWSFAGGSGSGTSAEQVDIANPGDTLYHVAVHGWQTDGSSTSDYTLFSWAIGSDADNLDVGPLPPAVLGTSGTVDIEWKDLEVDTMYLGRLLHGDEGLDSLAVTVININT